MPSFDIVSKVDSQTLDNAINTVKKELSTRYDFKDSKGSIELDKKSNILHITTENDMRLRTIEDIIVGRAVKQGIDGTAFDFSKDGYQSGPMYKKDVPVKSGIEKEVSKKINKLIKDSGLKVQSSIMDDQIRVTAKKKDDLQGVIAMLRRADVGQPLQFINMKS